MARNRRIPRGKPSLKKSNPNVPKLEKAEVMKKTTDPTEDGANVIADKTEESTVVCLSHIPHGFYEPQMTKYFSQFGVVKRLRLSRSKKSGRSKGYAFIEFEFPDVAKIVAETMNGYLTYQKIMKCRVIPTDKVHPKLFYGSKQKFRKPWHREASIKRVNSLLTAPADRIHTAQKRRVQLERRKNRKLEKLGIAFKCDTLDKEWESLKGSVPGVKSPKLKWKKQQKDSPTSPGSGKRKKHLTRRGGDESPSAKKSKSGHKNEEEPENYSSDEQETLLPLKSPAKLSLTIEEEEESSDDLSSETSSVLLAEPEEKVWTGKKTGQTSPKNVKATSPITKKKKKGELQLPTPKLVEREKTPKSVKKTDKGKAKMPTSNGASVKKTPRKPKTPMKAVGSIKKEPKTPKSGKVKTPKSGKKNYNKV